MGIIPIPKFSTDDDENDGNLAGVIKVFVVFIVLAALIYSEIMFLSIVSIAFPNGFIGSIAVVGALVTGASFLALYFGKTHWFLGKTPQFYAAVAFTAVEIIIMVLNDIVAYMLQSHQDLGYLLAWKDITPASPLVAIVGWAVIAYLDPGNKIKQMKMKAAQQKKELEIKYEMLSVQTQHNLQHEQLQQVVARLDDAMAEPAVQKQINDFASRLVARTLTQATGINAFTPRQPSSKTVDAAATPVSLAQTAQVQEQRQDPQ